MAMTEILFLSPVPISTQVRLARILKGWTQWETAYEATKYMRDHGKPPIVKIQISDIGSLELGRCVKPWRKSAILGVLGLDDA